LNTTHPEKKIKIDVCIVTKGRASNVPNLRRNVPVNKVIVEGSTPLAFARMRAIQKVETEWFVFIDEDVWLTETWFDAIRSFIGEDVGAVQGIGYVTGLGEKWDEDLNAYRVSTHIRELRLGERGHTHNTLIRTKLVKDWKPSRKDLSAWEDYEITQHILKKGYKWLVVPAKAYHTKSWRNVWKNAVWSMENWKKINSRKSWFKKTVLNSAYLSQLLFDWISISMPFRARVYFSYLTLGSIWGLLKR